MNKGLLLLGSVIGIGFALVEKKPKTSAPSGGSSGGTAPAPQSGPGTSEGPDVVPPLPNFPVPPQPPAPTAQDLLPLCLDGNLNSVEREQAVSLLLFSLTDFQASDGGDREQFARLIDEAAQKASAHAHPQLFFCLAAKSAAVRAGGEGVPTMTATGPKF